MRPGTISGWYVCSGRKNGVCDGLRVRMEDVDEAILAYLADVGIDADRSPKMMREADAERRDHVTAILGVGPH
jgi:hypothetical protein